jgi:hypothetical protein
MSIDRSVRIERVDLLIANLLIEYVSVEEFVAFAAANARAIGVLSCVIQRNDAAGFVSATDSSSSFDALASVSSDIDPETLTSAMSDAGFARSMILVDARTGREVEPVVVDAATGSRVDGLEYEFAAGPAAGPIMGQRYEGATHARASARTPTSVPVRRRRRRPNRPDRGRHVDGLPSRGDRSTCGTLLPDVMCCRGSYAASASSSWA